MLCRSTIFVNMSTVTTTPLADDYQIFWSSVLGEGVSGKIYRALSRRTLKSVALKILPDNAESRREVDSQLLSDHSHVLPILSVYANSLVLPGETTGASRIAVVMPLMAGGELFNRLDNINHRDEYMLESDIKAIIYQLALALDHIHSKGLVHRDVKLENVLLTCQGASCNHVRLGDFGFTIPSADVQEHKVLYTAHNGSPEVLRAHHASSKGTRAATLEYGPKSDMWALGVAMYCCCFGYHPFSSGDGSDLYRRVLSGKFIYRYNEWSRLSLDAQNVLRQLLDIRENRRPSAQELLQNPWFTDVNTMFCKCCPSPLNEMIEPTNDEFVVHVHVVQEGSWACILTVPLPSKEQTEIEHLMQIIEGRIGVAVSDQRYVYQQKRLASKGTLAELNVAHNSAMYLVPKVATPPASPFSQ